MWNQYYNEPCVHLIYSDITISMFILDTKTSFYKKDIAVSSVNSLRYHSFPKVQTRTGHNQMNIKCTNNIFHCFTLQESYCIVIRRLFYAFGYFPLIFTSKLIHLFYNFTHFVHAFFRHLLVFQVQL